MAGTPFSFLDLNKNKKGTGTVGGIIIEKAPELEIRPPEAGLANATSLTGQAPRDIEWKAYADLFTEGYFTKEWQDDFEVKHGFQHGYFRRTLEPVLLDLATREIRAREAARIQAEQVRRNSEIAHKDKIELPCCGNFADPSIRLSFEAQSKRHYLTCHRCGVKTYVQIKVLKK